MIKKKNLKNTSKTYFYLNQIKDFLIRKNLIPYEEFSLKSSIKKDDLKLSLQFNLEWNEELGMSFNKNSIKNYEGFLENDNFKLRRILK